MRKAALIAWLLTLPLLLVSLAPGQAPSPAAAPIEAKVGGRRSPDGAVEIQIDLPGRLHQHNIGSPPPNGPGCCVFRSIDHASRWQGVPVLRELPEWMVSAHIAGGGWPEKVDAVLAQRCKAAGVAIPDYIHVRGADLEILRLACATGRMPCVTYCYSPTGRYQGQRIAHMVNLAHCDERWVAVLDNNYMPTAPAEPDNYEWMTPAQFGPIYTGNGGGWAVILLDSGPPPVPRN